TGSEDEARGNEEGGAGSRLPLLRPSPGQNSLYSRGLPSHRTSFTTSQPTSRIGPMVNSSQVPIPSAAPKTQNASFSAAIASSAMKNQGISVPSSERSPSFVAMGSSGV